MRPPLLPGLRLAGLSLIIAGTLLATPVVAQQFRIPDIQPPVIYVGQTFVNWALPALEGPQGAVAGATYRLWKTDSPTRTVDTPDLVFFPGTRVLWGQPQQRTTHPRGLVIPPKGYAVQYTYEATPPGGSPLIRTFTVAFQAPTARINGPHYARSGALVVLTGLGSRFGRVRERNAYWWQQNENNTPRIPGLGHLSYTRSREARFIAPEVSRPTDILIELRVNTNDWPSDTRRLVFSEPATQIITIYPRNEALNFDGGITDKTYTVGVPIPPVTLPQATGGFGLLSYTLTPELPAGLSFDPASRVLSGTPQETRGKTTYLYAVADSSTPKNGDVIPFGIAVVSSGTNSRPEFDGDSHFVEFRAKRDNVAELPEAHDGNGDIVYALEPDALPAGLSFDPQGRVLEGNPQRAASPRIYTYTASDSDDDTGPGDTDTMSVTLVVVADPVSFGDQTIESQSFPNYRNIAPVTLPEATGGSGEISYALTPALPNGLTFDRDARQIRGRPRVPQDPLPSTEHTFTATDEDGNSASLKFTAAVVTNELDRIGVNTGTVIEDDPRHATALGAMKVGSTIAYSAVSDYGVFVLGSDGSWTYILDNEKPATNALRSGQSVTDSFEVYGGASSDRPGVLVEEVEVTISGANDSPTPRIRPEFPQSGRIYVAYSGENLKLDGSDSSDPEEDADENGGLAYRWTVSGAAAIEGSSDGASVDIQIADLATTPGSGEAGLVVTDREGLNVWAPFEFTVLPGENQRPVADAGNPQTVDENVVVHLDGGDSFDPDGSHEVVGLWYRWTQIAGDSVILTTDGAQDPRIRFVSPETSGTDKELVFELVVTDASGLESEPDRVSVTVTPGVNLGINFPDIPEQTVNEGELVTLDASGARDPSGQTLAYSWVQALSFGPPLVPQHPGHVVQLSDPAIVNPTFTAPVQLADDRRLQFFVTATVGRRLAREVARVRVLAGPNDPPVVAVRAPETVTQDTAVTLTATATDPENTALTYSWNQTGNGPEVTLAGTNTPTVTFTAPKSVGDRMLELTLSVTDSGTAHPTEGDPQTTSVKALIAVVSEPAIIGGVSSGAVVEATADAPGVPEATGTLTVSDPDSPDTFRTEVIPATGVYGSLEITAAGVWTYRLDNDDPETQALTGSESDPVTDAFTVRTADGTEATVTITVTGADDPAVFSGQSSGQVMEAANAHLDDQISPDARRPGTPVATGTLQISDVDGENTVALAGDAAESGAISGTYGSFGIAANGDWTYTLDNEREATNALRAGQRDDSEIFRVESADGTQATVTISVTGANDLPVIDGGPNQNVNSGQAVTLDAGSTGDDPEGDPLQFEWHSARNTQISTDGPITLDPGTGHRIAGKTATFRAPEVRSATTYYFAIWVGDGEAFYWDYVHITVYPRPTITGELSGAVTEDHETDGDSGLLSITNPNPDGSRAFVESTVAGTYGTFSLTARGAWTYTLDNDAPETNALRQGQTGTDEFEVRVDDGAVPNNKTTVAITVSGADDGLVVEAGPNQNVNSGQTVTLQASAHSDNPGARPIRYEWNGFRANVWRSPPRTARATFTAPEVTSVTTLLLLLNVDDGVIVATDDVTINVYPRPTIDGDVAGQVTEDDAVDTATGRLRVSNDNPDGAETFVESAFTGTYGTFSLAASGDWTYTLDNSDSDTDALVRTQTGTETFTMRVDDGADPANEQTVTITVNGANDPPRVDAGPDQNVNSGQTVTLQASVQTDDPAAGSVAFRWTPPDGVTLTPANRQTATFVAPEVASPTDFDFSATAFQVLETGTDTVRVTVYPRPVIGGNLSGDVIEDDTENAADSGKLTVSNPNPDGATAFVGETVAGTYGSLVLTADGDWAYTLNNEIPDTDALAEGEEQTESLTVRVDDGAAPENTAVLTITVTGANDAPVAANDEAVLAEGSSSQVDVLANDGDVDSPRESLSVAVVEGPAHGTATPNQDGNVVYTHDGSETASDSFTYKAKDGNADSAPATVTVTVTPVNDPPTAEAGQPQEVAEEETGTLTGTGSDPESGALTYAWAQIAGEPAAALSDDDTATPGLTAPQVLADTTLTFALTVTDDGGLKATDTVTVTVTGDNDPPTVTASGPETAAEDTLVTLTGTATDPEGQTLTYAWSQTGGTPEAALAGGNTPTATFTAPQVIADTDLTFTLTVTDDGGTAPAQTAAASVTVMVTGANDAAIIAGERTGAVTEDAETDTATGTLTAADPDGPDSFRAQTETAGTYGSFRITAEGVWTYTLDNADSDTDALAASEQVEDTFTVRTADGTEATVTVTVTGANDAPTAVEDAVTVAEGGTATVEVLANDTDPDTSAASLTAAAVTQPARGTLILNADGNFSYTHDGSETASDSFTYRVNDGSTGSAPATVTVTVTPVNDPPTAEAGQPQEVAEEETATLTGTGSDPEGGALSYAWAQTGGAPRVALTNANVAIATFAAPQVTADTELTFALTVTDDGSLSDTDTVKVTITGDNDPPTVTASGPQTAAEGTSVTLTGTATDPEGRTLTYVWTQTGGTPEATLAGENALTATFTAPQVTANTDLTFTLAVTDDGGTAPAQTATAAVTVTVTGDNDAAVIAGTRTGAVTEDAPTDTTTGTLTATDPDGPDSFQTRVDPATGTYGSLSITAEGAWIYTLDNTDPATDALAAGEQVEDTFTVRATDGTPATVAVTVAGANDAATITGDRAGAVTEDAETDTATGSLTVRDTDGPDSFQAQEEIAGTHGSFEITAEGAWTYTLDNTDPATDALAAGEQVEDTFTVRATDGTPATVAVTVTGANDAATITGDRAGAVTEDAEIDTATGTLTATDTDGLDSFQAQAGTGGTYGSFEITAEGAWIYTLDNTDPATDALADGVQVQDTFTVQAADGTPATVTITVTGANDAPTAVEDAVTVAEGGTATVEVLANDTDPDTPAASLTAAAVTQPARGTLTLNPDGTFIYTHDGSETVSDSFTYRTNDGSADSAPATVTVTVTPVNDPPTAEAGQPQEVAEEETATLTGTGSDPEGGALSYAWTQTGGSPRIALTNANAAVATFSAPQVTADTELTFTLTVTDDGGLEAADTVIVTVTGDNDAAIIVGTRTGTVTEDAPTNTATGTLTATDPDGLDSFRAQAEAVGTYGSLSITAEGAWIYTLDNADSDTDALAAGEQETDTFTVQAADGTEATVTITVDGANDAATIAGDRAGAVTEDAETDTATGSLTVSDVDGPDSFQTGVDPPRGVYGTLTITPGGAWIYTLDNADSDTDALAAGEQVEDAFTVRAADGTEATVTITVDGANDAATIAGDRAGAVTEDAETDTATGSLTVSDADGPDSFQAQTEIAGTYGSLSTTTEGTWTYTLANTDPATDALVAGEQVEDAFTVRAADGTPATVTITVTGANDAATITGDRAGAVTEDSPTDTATGSLTATDPDGPDSFQTGVDPPRGVYGALTITPGGAWTYLLDNVDSDTDALAAAEQVEDAFTVQTADGTETTVTITVTGANDAPTAVEDTVTVAEGGTATVEILANDTDPDTPAASLTAAAVAPPAHGTLTLNADGAFSYTHDGSETTGDSFTYKIHDGSADSAPATVTVTVTPVNDPPTAEAGQPQEVAEEETATLTGTGSDPEGGTLAYAWAQTGGSPRIALTNANAAVATFPAPQVLTNTALTFTLTVTDDGDLEATDTVIITVTGDNDPPVVDAGNPQTVPEGAAVTLGGTATDPEGQTLTYAWSQTGGAPSVTLTDAATATARFTAPQLAEDAALTFTLRATDAGGATGSASVTVSVRADDDAATIAGDRAGAVTEDAPTDTATGILTATDPDGPDRFQAQTESTGTYGNLSITEEGAWTYTLDNGDSDTNALAADEQGTDSFTVQAADGTPAMVTITVTGANDAATIAGDLAGAITEDAPTDTATGTLTAADPDGPDRFQAQAESTGIYGNLSITAEGTWTYTIDNTDSDTDALAAGQRETDAFTVRAADGTPATVTITVTGANDAATIAGDRDGAVTEDAPTDTATGTLTATDPDGPDRFQAQTETTGTYGSLSITAEGAWTYTLDNGNPDTGALAAGQQQTEAFTVRTADGTETVVSIAVTGANDAPTAADEAITVAEGDTATTLASGDTSVLVNDTDVDTPHAALTAAVADEPQHGRLALNTDGTFSYIHDGSETTSDSFTYRVSDGADNSAPATVTVTVTPVNDPPAVDAGGPQTVTEGSAVTLGGTAIDPEGQTLTYAWNQTGGAPSVTLTDAAEATARFTAPQLATDATLTFTLRVTDAGGAVGSASVTVSVQADDDAATITGDLAGTVIEDAEIDAATGTLTASDTDGPDSFQAQAGAGGTYGSFRITEEGAWTYTIDNNDPETNALAAGQRETDAFTVQAADGTPATVTITVTGANDAASIDGATAGAVTEDAEFNRVAGTLTISDVDGPDLFKTDAIPTPGVFGSLSITAEGVWIYTLNNDDPDTDALADGIQAQDAFTVRAADGTPATVTITVTGANDAAVITRPGDGPGGGDAGTGTVTEDAPTNTATGTLTISDSDGPETFRTSVDPATGTYGSLSITEEGAWTYTLDNGDPDTDALAADEQVTDAFTVRATDGTPATVTITVIGANDAPVVSAGDPQTVAEGAAVTLGGTATDPESQTLTYAWSQTGGAPSVTLTDAAKATARFTAPQLAADAALTFTLKVTDAGGAVGSASVTISVQADDDAATITGDRAGTVTEDAATNTATGTLTATDTDGPDRFQAQAGTGGTYGSFKVTAEGAWTYTLDNGNPDTDALAADEQVTDAFTVRATDGTPATVTITVTGANDAPLVSAGDPQTVAEGAAVTLGGTATDPESQTLTYAWSQTGGAPSVTLTDAAKATARFTAPQLAADAALTFTLKVTDAGGAVGSASVTISVQADDDAATITGDRAGTVTEDAPTDTATGTLTATDTDGPDSFQAQAGTGGTYGSFKVTEAGAWTYTLDNGNPDTDALAADERVEDSFTVRAADGTEATVTITVTGANDAPVVSAGDPQTVAEGAAVTLAGTAIDPEGQTLTYAWSQTGGAPSVTLTDAAKATARFTAPQLAADAALIFTLKVTDAGGAVGSASVTISVQADDDAATITGDLTGAVTEDAEIDTATGTLTVTDPDSPDRFQTQAGTGGTYGSFKITAEGAWTYTLDNGNPDTDALAADERVEDSFTVRAADGTEATVTITVIGANDAPVVSAGDPQTVAEGAAVTLGGTATDPESQTLTYAWSQTGGAPSVTLTDAAKATARFTAPQLAADAALTFTLKVTDAGGAVGSASVTISVRADDDAATIAGDLTGAVTEDAEIDTATGTLTVTDPDSPDRFQTQAGTGGTYGSFKITAEGAWTYTLDNGNPDTDALAAGQQETDTFTVQAADGTPATVTVTVTGANDAPTAADDAVTVTEAGTAIVEVLANDKDPDTPAASLTAATVTPPTHGTLTLSPDGAFIYEHDGSEESTDRFTYTASDDAGGTSDAATVAITVIPVNDPPVADAGPAQMVDEEMAVTLAGNGRDPENRPLDYSWVQTAGEPEVTLSGDDTAAPGFTAPQLLAGTTLTFALTVTDDGNLSDTDTVEIIILADNDPPTVTASGPQTVAEGTSVTLTGTATDPEDRTLTYVWTQTGGTPKAALAGENAPTATFTAPQVTANTDLTFTLTVTDDGETAPAQTATAAVTVTVTGDNDAAVIAGARTGAVTEDAETDTAAGTLTATDPDGPDSFQTGVDPPRGVYGTLTITPVGAWTYTLDNADSDTDALAAGQQETDTFTVQAADGTEATVTVTVTGANDAPTAVDDAVTVAEDDTVTVEVLANDTDPDTTAASLTAAAVTQPEHGTLTLNPDGAFIYTHDGSETASDSFTYRVNDGSADSAPATVTVTVTPVNDPPTAEAGQPQEVAEEETATLTGTGSDPEGGALSYAWTQTGGSPRIALTNANAAVATFSAPQVTADTELTFTLTVTDDGGLSDTDTVEVTITGDNDPPVVDAGNPQTVPEDAAVTLGGTVVDPEGQTLTYAWSQTGGTPSVTLTDAATATARFTAPQLVADAALTFTLKATDAGGAVGSASVTISVRADDDAATIAGDLTGAVTEDAPTNTATGTLTATDPDGPDSFLTGVDPPRGVYGTLTITPIGAWTYTLDNADSDTDALAAGQRETDTFRVQAADGTEATVTVTVTGANDAATIAGARTGAVTEDAETDTATGTLTAADPDGPDSFRAQTQAAGTYGSFRITAEGAWTYTLDNADSDTDALAAGQQETDAFTVQAADGTPATVTITVTGANDAPVAVGRIPALTVVVGTSKTVDVAGHFDDPDDATLAFTAESDRPDIATSSVAAGTDIVTASGITPGSATITVIAADPDGRTAEQTIDVEVVSASPVPVTLDTIAGDNVVNIEENTAGFTISGTTGTGAAVNVALGSGNSRTASVSGAVWTLDIPAADGDVVEGALEVVATATISGRPDGTARRSVTVDLTPPAAEWTVPTALQVGVAVALEPTNAADDLPETAAYSLQSGVLPPGMTLDPDTGAVQGVPTRASGTETPVSVELTDRAGNDGRVAIIFPPVDKGTQTLSGFGYRPAILRLDEALPALVPPEIDPPLSRTGSSLSYTSNDESFCTVDAATGALILRNEGTCTIRALLSETADYNPASAEATVTFTPHPFLVGKTEFFISEEMPVATKFSEPMEAVNFPVAKASWSLVKGPDVPVSIDAGSGEMFVSDTLDANAGPHIFGMQLVQGGARAEATIKVTVMPAGQLGPDGQPLDPERLKLPQPRNLVFTVGRKGEEALPEAGGGTAPYTYALLDSGGAANAILPPGLEFDRDARTVTGTPTEARDETMVTYLVTDAAAGEVSRTFTIRVREAGLRRSAERALAGFGRTVLTSATAAIDERIDAGPGASGQSSFRAWIDSMARQAKRDGHWGDADFLGAESETLTLKPPERFALGRGEGDRGSWSIWGQWDAQSSEARDYDVTTRSVYFGADLQMTDDLMVGMAVSRNSGDSSFSAGETRLSMDNHLKMVLPYASFAPAAESRIWVIGGAGKGRVSVGGGPDGGSSDLDVRLLAAGARHELAGGGGWELDAFGDYAWIGLETGPGTGLGANLDVSPSRLRAGLEGSAVFDRDFGTLTPFASIGLRRDGGVDLSGTGVEIEGGVRVNSQRVSLEAKGRALFAHSEDNYKEHGFSVRASMTPAADGAGLSFSLEPRWGRRLESEDSVFFERYVWTPLDNDGGSGRSAVTGEIGYGVLSPSGNHLIRPFLSFDRADGNFSKVFVGTEIGGTGRYSGMTLNLGVGREQDGPTGRAGNYFIIKISLSM